MGELYQAAISGDLNLCSTLIENGMDVNSCDVMKRVPLHGAAQKGHLDICKLLLEKGARVDQRGFLGSTALEFAAGCEKDEATALQICELLLQHSASVHARDACGETALHFAVQAGHPGVVEFLLSRQATVDHVSAYGFTPLIEAAMVNDERCCKILLEAGANPLLRNNEGNSAEDLAKDPEVQSLFGKKRKRTQETSKT